MFRLTLLYMYRYVPSTKGDELTKMSSSFRFGSFCNQVSTLKSLPLPRVSHNKKWSSILKIRSSFYSFWGYIQTGNPLSCFVQDPKAWFNARLWQHYQRWHLHHQSRISVSASTCINPDQFPRTGLCKFIVYITRSIPKVGRRNRIHINISIDTSMDHD